jgi:hypothetical protein
MTASFNPALLPPGGTVTNFALTIQAPKSTATAGNRAWRIEPFVGLAALLPFVLSWRRRWAGGLALIALIATAGCGDRVLSTANSAASIASYAITVSGTATGPTGAVLQHTAVVMLNVQ